MGRTPVPEAPVDEHGDLGSRENDVGRASGQDGMVDSIAQTRRIQES